MIQFRWMKPSTRILFQCKFGYVRKSEIDNICVGYGDSWKDKIKMYTMMFAHIAKEGFMGARQDIFKYKDLKAKSKQQRTSEDWNELVRIRHDFYRLGPLVIIQILPMSGPLFMLYMYTYPGSIPSWFLIDKFHEQYEHRIRQQQKIAVDYFKKQGLRPQDVNFDQMSLFEARKLAECLYGYYRDGTLGYRRLFKKNIRYVISQGFSKYLIRRKLKYKFSADLEHEDILQNLSFDQKIRWKYEQVVVRGNLLKDYEDTLTSKELEARKQCKAEQVEKEKGSKPVDNNKK